MSLRESLGLPPGGGIRIAMELELRRRVEAWNRPGFAYRGSADLLLQHGQYFAGRRTPDEYAHLIGPMGGCFENAVAACEAAPELRYFLGHYDTGGGHFTPHAWCVAPDGGVVEVTLPTDIQRYAHVRTHLPFLPPDRYGYWGVELRPELVLWALDTFDNACLLDRPAADFEWEGEWDEADELPLLMHPYDPTRVSF